MLAFMDACLLLLFCPQQQWWRSINECISVSVCVCLSVCLSVREYISGTTRVIFTKFLLHVAYGRGSILPRRGNTIAREWAILGVFFPVVWAA